MKIKYIVEFVIFGIIMSSCQTSSRTASYEKLKSEIFEVEKAFSAMAQSDGVEKVFIHFSATFY